MGWYLAVSVVIIATVLLALWWRSRRVAPEAGLTKAPEDRLDTLIGWPPEPMRILRPAEREAFSILKQALPGHMILAQVQVSRFVSVPRENAYPEWMRRVGSQCVDLVACDKDSEVTAVIEIRPADKLMSDRVRRRLRRVDRTLAAAGIPVHIWEEAALPSVGDARLLLKPREHRPFADTSPQLLPRREPLPLVEDVGYEAAAFVPPIDAGSEVTEMSDPSSWTWFDDIESTTPEPAATPADAVELEPRPSR